MLCSFYIKIRLAPPRSRLWFEIVLLPTQEGDHITLFPLHYSNQMQTGFIKKNKLTTTRIPYTRLFYIHSQPYKWWLLRDTDSWKSNLHKEDWKNICLVTQSSTLLLVPEPSSHFSMNTILFDFQVTINITIVSLTYLYMIDISNWVATFKIY